MSMLKITCCFVHFLAELFRTSSHNVRIYQLNNTVKIKGKAYLNPYHANVENRVRS